MSPEQQARQAMPELRPIESEAMWWSRRCSRSRMWRGKLARDLTQGRWEGLIAYPGLMGARWKVLWPGPLRANINPNNHCSSPPRPPNKQSPYFFTSTFAYAIGEFDDAQRCIDEANGDRNDKGKLV